MVVVLTACMLASCSKRTPTAQAPGPDSATAGIASRSAMAFPASLGPAIGRDDSLMLASTPALQPWVAMWREAMPGFALDSLHCGDSMAGLRGGSVQSLRDFTAMGTRDSLRVFSIDSPGERYTLVFDRYQGIIDAGGVIGIGGNVDSAPVLIDHRRGLANTFAFCGPACAFEWGAWIDSSRFAVAGSIGGTPNSGTPGGYLDVISIPDSTQVRYWTRALTTDELKAYRMAWGMWVKDRYREIQASRRHY
jgi:hypothetical protein